MAKRTAAASHPPTSVPLNPRDLVQGPYQALSAVMNKMSGQEKYDALVSDVLNYVHGEAQQILLNKRDPKYIFLGGNSSLINCVVDSAEAVECDKAFGEGYYEHGQWPLPHGTTQIITRLRHIPSEQSNGSHFIVCLRMYTAEELGCTHEFAARVKDCFSLAAQDTGVLITDRVRVNRRQLPCFIKSFAGRITHELGASRLVRFIEVQGCFPGLEKNDKLSIFNFTGWGTEVTHRHLDTLAGLLGEGDCALMLAEPSTENVAPLGPLIIRAIRAKHRLAPSIVALSSVGEGRYRISHVQDLLFATLRRCVGREIDSGALFYRHEYIRQLRNLSDSLVLSPGATDDIFSRIRVVLDNHALAVFSSGLLRAIHLTRRLVGDRDLSSNPHSKELEVMRSFCASLHTTIIIQRQGEELGDLLFGEVDAAMAKVRSLDCASLQPGQLDGDVRAAFVRALKRTARCHAQSLISATTIQIAGLVCANLFRKFAVRRRVSKTAHVTSRFLYTLGNEYSTISAMLSDTHSLVENILVFDGISKDEFTPDEYQTMCDDFYDFLSIFSNDVGECVWEDVKGNRRKRWLAQAVDTCVATIIRILNGRVAVNFLDSDSAARDIFQSALHPVLEAVQGVTQEVLGNDLLHAIAPGVYDPTVASEVKIALDSASHLVRACRTNSRSAVRAHTYREVFVLPTVCDAALVVLRIPIQCLTVTPVDSLFTRYLRGSVTTIPSPAVTLENDSSQGFGLLKRIGDGHRLLFQHSRASDLRTALSTRGCSKLAPAICCIMDHSDIDSMVAHPFVLNHNSLEQTENEAICVQHLLFYICAAPNLAERVQRRLNELDEAAGITVPDTQTYVVAVCWDNAMPSELLHAMHMLFALHGVHYWWLLPPSLHRMCHYDELAITTELCSTPAAMRAAELVLFSLEKEALQLLRRDTRLSSSLVDLEFDVGGMSDVEVLVLNEVCAKVRNSIHDMSSATDILRFAHYLTRNVSAVLHDVFGNQQGARYTQLKNILQALRPVERLLPHILQPLDAWFRVTTLYFGPASHALVTALASDPVKVTHKPRITRATPMLVNGLANPNFSTTRGSCTEVMQAAFIDGFYTKPSANNMTIPRCHLLLRNYAYSN